MVDSVFEVDALLLTLRLAGLTTVLLMVIAVPLAAVLAFAQTRWRALLEAMVALPLVLPPTVLGFYLLVGFSPLTWAGRAAEAVLGHQLVFSFAGLVVGSVLYSLPFAVQPLAAGLRAVEPRLLEAAATLGVGPVQRLMRVALPLAKGSLLAAAVLTFTHTVGEFGVVLMLGGKIPGVTRTLSISLYDLVEGGHFDEAGRVALVLLGFSTVALVALYTAPLPGLRGRRS